jgi:3-oxoacyl-[acyl-carrier protein] reductase
MDLGIKDKVAIVTGASSGIGWSCAVELAREGAKVCAVGRNQERLAGVLREMQALGAEAITVSADLSTEEGCRSAVDACVQRFGSVEILINVAGAAQPHHVLTLPTSMIDDALSLKTYGYLRLSQLCVPYMQRKQWGRIVNIAGAAGSSPDAINLPVSFANVTVMNLTHSLSDVVAKDGILVNVICPGGVDTPRTRARRQPEAERTGRSMDDILADAGKELPAGRIGRPEEIAKVAAFLASEPCSYVFASAIYMDGGHRRATP